MEMNELFYKNAYQKSFDACVLACEVCKGGYDVILEDTVFYPEGGGQPCDMGILDGFEVYDVQRDKQDVIHHFVKGKVDVGKMVHGEIDWQRRFDLMQNHSGEHIISGLVHKKFGYENVGFHMGEVIQIDLSGPLDWKTCLEIEREANAIIWENIPITITYPNENALAALQYRSKKELVGKVRIVTIGEADVCACCGTHVAYTGEIGLIKMLSCVKHKDGVRIELVCGERALLYMEKAYEQVRKISTTLSSKPFLIGNAVDKLLETNVKLTQRVKDSVASALDNRFEQIQENTPLVIEFVEGVERNASVNYANRLVVEKRVGVACVMNLEENGTYSYVMISHCVDLKKYVKECNALLHGRGGGKQDIVQGSFSSSADEIQKRLAEVFL